MARGVGFQLEHEMLDSARRWLTLRGFEAKEEFVLPWGICDLVGVSFYKSRVSKRLQLGQRRPIGPPRRIDLLTRIPDVMTGDAVSIASLKKQLNEFVTGDDVEAEIDALIRSKFVVRNTATSVQKLNGWMPLSKSLVTVELKLNRISEALSQAKAHRCVADEAYIGLPSELAQRVVGSQRRKVFTANGVGILAVGRKECQVLLPSAKVATQQFFVLKVHCVERFWRASIKGRSA
jgi:hypothetical protein